MCLSISCSTHPVAWLGASCRTNCARALHEHTGKVTAFVPHYAIPGGTLKKKSIAEIDDATLILADQAEKALRQVQESVLELLEQRYSAEQVARLAHLLS